MRAHRIPLLLAACGMLAASCDLSVTEIPRERKLAASEIAERLKSDDLSARIEARRQLDSLDEAERLRLLETLLDSRDTSDRLVAVQALGSMQTPGSRAVLERAAVDPDPLVSSAAKEMLAPQEPQSGQPAEIEEEEAE